MHFDTDKTVQCRYISHSYIWNEQFINKKKNSGHHCLINSIFKSTLFNKDRFYKSEVKTKPKIHYIQKNLKY